VESLALFDFLIPFVFASFVVEASGSPTLIECLCTVMDTNQTRNLLKDKRKRADFSLFRKDTFVEVLRLSLKWNTFAQSTFWQLLRSELDFDLIFSALPIIKEQKHPMFCLELTCLLQYMDIDITASVVRGMFCRPTNDRLTLEILEVSISVRK
jgi:hypothetical protein